MSADLVPIVMGNVGEALVPAVDSRELHAALGVKSPHRNWIVERVKDARLVRGRDFEVSQKKMRNTGRPQVSYLISIDAAKHVAMLERTEMGRKIRAYFIAVEKRLKPTDASDLFETLGVEISLFNHDVQRDQSKAFAAATSHKDRIIDGRVKMCLAVTGRTPKRVREQGEALGLSKRDRESAPQVLRAIGDIGAPVYAAINLMVSSGTPLHDATKLKPELETNFSSLRETLLKGGVSERHFAKIPRERVAQLLSDHEAQRQALDRQLLLDLGG